MTSRSILLVDDEASILESLGWALRKNGFRVTTATGGQEALDHLGRCRFDLVITDLSMAIVDGIGVLKHAKSLQPDIAVIILTGYGNVPSAVKAMQLGADDYLQKPCDIADLLNRARRSFERQDLVAELRDRNEHLRREVAARKIVEIQLKQSRDTLEQTVAERTQELAESLAEMKNLCHRLLIREEEIGKKNRELEEINTTLSVLLKRRDQEQTNVRKEIAAKAQALVLPLLNRIQGTVKGLNKDYLETAQSHLADILSENQHDAALTNAKLSPRELQVVHCIRQGKSSKEMADLLGLSERTVTTYRGNIRKKVRIKNKKTNLKIFLTSLL